MRKHKLALAGVTLLAASLAMTACGSRAEQAPGGEAGAAKVAKIGVIAPLSGDLSALGPASRTQSIWPSSRPTRSRPSRDGRWRSTRRMTRPLPTLARTQPRNWPVTTR